MRPTGTVTLLFSDIEGSTRLLRAIGVERYESALQQHRLLLRDAFARHAGYEVDTEGDSFFVAFGRALDAVHAALDAQYALAGHEWVDGERIRVRIGIHTCEATVIESHYVGMGVHRTARICAAGHGDQIVLSQTTRDLLQDESGVACLDLGVHPLKDFAQPQRLYQLVDPRLPQAFPPLRTPLDRPTNLTTPPTPLVGREIELEAIRTLAREGAERGILVPVRFEGASLPIDVRALHTTDFDDWGGTPRARGSRKCCARSAPSSLASARPNPRRPSPNRYRPLPPSGPLASPSASCPSPT